MMLAAGYRLLVLAAENQGYRRGKSSTSFISGSSEAATVRGEVLAVGVEAVSPQEVADLRVLTAVRCRSWAHNW